MNRIWIVLIISLLSFSSYAQQAADKTSKGKHKTAKHKAKKTAEMPHWAAAHNYDGTAHVYFPDYYTYYDPQRAGYVYWDNGHWIVTPSVPPYMEKVDLDKSRIKILKGLSLDLHPELDYPNYMKLYPADHENNMVQVPGDH